MSATAAQLAPVFLLVLLGQGMRRRGFPTAEFWRSAERLVYWWLFPSLLFAATADVRLAGLELGRIGAALFLPGLLIGLGLWVAVRAGVIGGPAFAALLQASLRQNTYVAFAAVGALWGPAALPATALIVALNVPVVNLVSVWALAWYGPSRPTPSALLRMVLVNPLVVACAMGLLWSLAELPLPRVAADTLEILARASLPLALLAVGAALDLPALREARGPVLLGAALKLVALPLLTFAAARLLGLDPLTAAALLLFSALPVSATAYVQTREMGGDAPLMAAAMTVQTLAAMLTLPLLVGLLA